MVRVDMLIWEYKDCLRFLDRLEALEEFRAIRGLVFIDKPLRVSLWL